MSIMHLKHSNHAPINLDEIEHEQCALATGRGVRHESLESIRYTVLTMKDLIEAIQNQWPYDRPIPPDLQAKLSFGVMAIAGLRSGDLRRLAESAQT